VTRGAAARARPTRLRIGALAKEAALPLATVKHYAREGLIAPVHSGRNTAFYGADALDRLQMIKELQRTRFLPLKVIKQLLNERPVATPHADVETFLARALDDRSGARSRAELLEAGVLDEHLEWLEGVGAIGRIQGPGGESYPADDVELLRTLGAARKAGIDASMLPLEIIQAYVEALRALVKVELTMFREGVLPRATGDVGSLVETATHLSEKLVVLLRRRLLVPTLRQLVAEGAPPEAPKERAKATGSRRRTGGR
jgi:DNA-binding transcriptional MerR regulator